MIFFSFSPSPLAPLREFSSSRLFPFSIFRDSRARFSSPDPCECQPDVLPEHVGFCLFLKQCNILLPFLCFWLFFHTLSLTHPSHCRTGYAPLTAEIFVLLVQYQLICTNIPFWKSHQAFLVFISPKSISVKNSIHPDFIYHNLIIGRVNGITSFLCESCRCFHRNPFLQIH